jgi:hypothetical protein
LAVNLVIEKKTGIVSIAEDEHPLSLAIAQPVVHKLEYVGRRVPPPGDLDAVGYVAIALLKPGCVTCVNPENPRLRRLLAGSIRKFDGKLRLASSQSAIGIRGAFHTHPTAPRPTSAVREHGTAHFWSI